MTTNILVIRMLQYSSMSSSDQTCPMFKTAATGLKLRIS